MTLAAVCQQIGIRQKSLKGLVSTTTYKKGLVTFFTENSIKKKEKKSAEICTLLDHSVYEVPYICWRICQWCWSEFVNRQNQGGFKSIKKGNK